MIIKVMRSWAMVDKKGKGMVVSLIAGTFKKEY
jgi:hypothetical protein